MPSVAAPVNHSTSGATLGCGRPCSIRAVERREHLVGRVGLGGDAAGSHGVGRVEKRHLEVVGIELSLDALVAPTTVGSEVGGGHDGPGPDLLPERSDHVHRVARADHETTAHRSVE